MTDWAVGDLAVCVDASPRGGKGPAGPLLTERAAYRVTYVVPPARWKEPGLAAGLIIDGPRNWDAPLGEWREDRFRKIRPDEHEACEQEFVTLIKRVPERVTGSREPSQSPLSRPVGFDPARDIAFIRRCREIDRLQNIVWADEAEREAGVANNAPVANQ